MMITMSMFPAPSRLPALGARTAFASLALATSACTAGAGVAFAPAETTIVQAPAPVATVTPVAAIPSQPVVVAPYENLAATQVVATTMPAPATIVAAPGVVPGYVVQVGSFASYPQAVRLQSVVARYVASPTIVTHTVRGSQIYRVVAGSYPTLAVAESRARVLQASGFDTFVRVY